MCYSIIINDSGNSGSIGFRNNEDCNGGTQTGSGAAGVNQGSNTPSCPDPNMEMVSGACFCKSGYVEDFNGVCQKKPCEGDPVKDPEIAPQKGMSGSKGALFGNPTFGNCTRFGANHCSGPRNKQHNGIDLKSNDGDPIYAMYDGFIYSNAYDKDGYGYLTFIQSTINGKTIIHSYAHLKKDNRVLQPPLVDP